MSKRCKICNELNENPLLKYCKKHYFEMEKVKPKKIYNIKTSFKKINNISKTNKNIPAKFSSKTKAEILIRDKNCIFCDKPITDIHHVFYSNEANRTQTRNNVDQGVWCCRDCHNEIHSCTTKQGKRQEAIDYLNNIY